MSRKLWILDLTTGSRRRLSPRDNSHWGFWSEDGEQIAYTSAIDGRWEILAQRVDEPDEPRVLHSEESYVQTMDWSPDGGYVIFYVQTESGSSDIWAVRADGSEEAFQVIAESAVEAGGEISEDGNWILYASDVSGQNEVYLSRFPDGDTTRQVSSGGAFGVPWWERGSESVGYFDLDDMWIRIPTEFRGSRVIFGEPSAYLDGKSSSEFFGEWRWLEEHPDGRFLVLKSETAGLSRLEIIYNWAATLE